MHRKRIFIPIILLMVALLATYWYLSTPKAAPAEEGLTGSGTVEATLITISPESFGRVAEVLVEEGDTVDAGAVLLRLDGNLLTAQLEQARANLAAAQAGMEVARQSYTSTLSALEIAQAQLNLALAQALQQSQPARRAAWSQPVPPEFDQPGWYYTQAELLSAALEEVNAAKVALEVEQAGFDDLRGSDSFTNLAAAEARLAQARLAFTVAQDVLQRSELQEDESLTEAAQQAYDAALDELEEAQDEYDTLLSSQAASDMLAQRARLAVAQERYDTAQDRFNSLLTGRDALAVQVAQASLRQAQGNVSLAESKVSQAQAAIDQAQAALEVVNVQIGKLTISAPVSGVVLARSIQPGEVVQPGAAVITLGDLEQLTITVFIPENRYGEVRLGQTARVQVDSFPGTSFSATVTRIADQAEFTPRNVQTAEGRATTVYAIELAVQDPEGLLKPGMPADVTFDVNK